jgi:polysaccharide chain length determinant protein (PEP-CTERM system associated)
MDQLDDLLRQARSVLRAMWQRRWVGLIVAWLVGSGAAIAIVRMPDLYEASARIFVDTQTVLKPLMSGLAVQPNVDQQVMILSRTLISRPNVEKLVRMADMDHRVTNPEDRQRLVDSLMGSLRISGAGGINLYTLSYWHSDPATAQRVVQSLTSMFVESSLGGKRKDTESAKQFIDEQIKVYEKKLLEAEDRLKNFKLRHLSLNIGEGRDAFGRIAEANAQLSQARLMLREAENSRDALKRQIAGEEPVLLGGVLEAPVASLNLSVPELDQRIEAQKRTLDGLLQRYTEAHPDVSGIRRVIHDLEEQKRQEIAARKAALASVKPQSASQFGSMANNPVYQQLKVSLAEAEANVASLQTRVAEYETRYNKAMSRIQLVPEIEAEFIQLNRDYGIHKSNYESLVARRESAAMSGEMEANAATAEFRLIDPPRVSRKPVAPNRVRLFSLALLGALAAGVAASLVASQISRRFFDAHALRSATGLPVLGTVSLIPSERMKRRERRGLIGFTAAAIALLGSYGAGILALSLLAARA